MKKIMIFSNALLLCICLLLGFLLLNALSAPCSKIPGRRTELCF